MLLEFAGFELGVYTFEADTRRDMLSHSADFAKSGGGEGGGGGEAIGGGGDGDGGGVGVGEGDGGGGEATYGGGGGTSAHRTADASSA